MRIIKMYKFYLGSFVWVKLTEAGLDALDELGREHPHEMDGWSKWALLDLFVTFGPSVKVGEPLPFGPEIRISESKLINISE